MATAVRRKQGNLWLWIVAAFFGFCCLVVALGLGLAKGSMVGVALTTASDQWLESALATAHLEGPRKIADDRNLRIALEKAGALAPANPRMDEIRASLAQRSSPMTDSERQELESYFKQSEKAVAAVRAAAKLTAFSTIPFREFDSDARQDNRAWRGAHLLINHSMLAWEKGRREEALRDLLDTLHLAKTINAGDAGKYDYIIGTSIQRKTLLWIRRRAPHLKEEKLRTILAALPETEPADRSFERAIGIDAYSVLTYLHTQDEPKDWVDSYEVGDPNMLVDRHNAGSFDERETGEAILEMLPVVQSNCLATWKDQSTEVSDKIRGLRESLPRWPRFGNGTQWADAIWRASRYREKMNSIPNSRGKKILLRMDSSSTVYNSFALRTETEATRFLVALQIYKLQKGKPPVDAQTLVHGGFLASLPSDYFSGEPLRYDPSREAVWSVWTNGRDDGGSSEWIEKARMKSADVVWKL